jgi:hypothetical protein
MRVRVEGLLGGVVALAGAQATWRSASAPAAQRGFGADRPVNSSASFIRADLPTDLRVAFVGTTTTSTPGTNVNTAAGNVIPQNPRLVPLPVPVDVERAFAAAEAAGGKDARASTEDWIAGVSAFMQNGVLVVNVSYTIANRGTLLGQFRYDPVSGAVTRFGP